MEAIEDIEYNNFVSAMDRLSSLPYSYKAKEFIYTFRKPLISQSNTYEIPKPQYDEQGRMFVTTYGGIIIIIYHINSLLIASAGFFHRMSAEEGSS